MTTAHFPIHNPRPLRWIGLAPLISVAMLVSVFFIADEGTAEFIFIAAPTPLLLLVPAIYKMQRMRAPFWSKWARLFGFVGMGSIATLTLLGTVLDLSGTSSFVLPQAATRFMLFLVMATGVWLMITGSLTLGMPSAHTLIRLLGAAAIVAGTGFVLILLLTSFVAPGQNPATIPLLTTLSSTAIFMFLLGLATWAVGTAIVLLVGKRL